MEKIRPGMLYVAVDGDGIGKLVGRAVIANDVEELHKVSARIDAAQEYINNWCKQNDGIKISGGGDESTMCIKPEARDKIKELRSGIEKSFGYTISVGVGKNLSEAGTALLVAKLRGKNRVIYFNKHINDDIKKAKRRVKEKRASPDEYKLAEAYLEKSESMICNLHKNKLCDLHKNEDDKPQIKQHNHENENDRTDDCAMCQYIDAQENADGTAGMHDDCPACQELDQTTASANANEGHDDCPYCNEMQANPEHEDTCRRPYCQQYDQEQSGVEAQDMGEDHPENCPECQEMYGEAVESSPAQSGQEDPNLQGHETAEEVLDLLDQEPGSGKEDPTQEARQIDNTEMPQGNQMKDNVSVKSNFGPAQAETISDADQDFQQNIQQGSQEVSDPSSPMPEEERVMGDSMSDEQPDMMGVLQNGLQDGEDQAQRERVVQMVSQTLQQFKANKQSLESTREQNEGLYTSCIQMLKSMIELCKLLGLEPSANASPMQDSAQPQQPSKQAAPQQNALPMQQKAAPGGAAPDPKTQG